MRGGSRAGSAAVPETRQAREPWEARAPFAIARRVALAVSAETDVEGCPLLAAAANHRGVVPLATGGGDHHGVRVPDRGGIGARVLLGSGEASRCECLAENEADPRGPSAM
jgi:hypothetical protein